MDSNVVQLEKRRQQNRDAQRRLREKQGKVEVAAGFLQHCWVCGDAFRTPDRNIRVCGDGGCAKRQSRQRLKPFTVAHFKRWALQVTLDTGKPWKVEQFQADYLEDIFAGVPEIWLLIAEANTKTTLLAGLGLYHCQFRKGGRVPIAAASRDQAMEMFFQAEAMVSNSEMLRPLFMPQEGSRRIKNPSMASRLQIFAADERTGDGAIFTLALLDELHRHRDLRLYQVWTGKRRKRGGQIAGISTAGEPGSEFEETRTRIRQTATERKERPGYLRAVSGPMVLHEYAVPDGANVEDLDAVKLANPFSGVTKKSLAEKRGSPTMTLAHWTRFTCNRATRSYAAAVTEAEWFGQRTDITIPLGVPIWAGLDLAWKWDTTALVPFWPRDPEFRLFGPATILTPPRNGDMLDPEEIEDALLALHEKNPIHTLVMDMSEAAPQAVWAQEHLGCEVVDRVQSSPLQCLDYKRFMTALREKWLFHSGDAGLTSHVLNATTKMYPDGTSKFVRPRKSRGSDQDMRVIDALTGASMVHNTYAAELEEPESGAILVGFA